MGVHIDRTGQLEEALRAGHGAQVASLRAAGVPQRQHNSKLTKKTAATKKATSKKTASKKATASKTAAKKSAAK